MGFPVSELETSVAANIKETSEKSDTILKCVYANLQSIFNKKHEIEEYIEETKIDMMFFTESFINDDHQPVEYDFIGYQCFVAKKQRGGACIYAKNSLSPYEIQPPNKTEDSCWVVINTKNYVKRLYGCVYRSPNSSQENNVKLMDNIIWAQEKYQEVILIGDFNLPTANWDTLTSQDSYTNNFLEILDNAGMEQLVQEPTRYRLSQTPSLLDLIIVNNPEIVCDVAVKNPFGKSDHCRIEFSVKNTYVKNTISTIRYNFRKIKEEIFLSQLNSMNWANIVGADIEQGYNKFIECVQNAIEKSTPRMKNIEKNVAPWSNPKIVNLSRRKRQQWDRYKFSKLTSDYETYKKTLNDFNREKDIAVEYYETIILANKSTKKKQYYNYVARNNKYGESKIVLRDENSVYSDDQKCANILNQYFSTVFTRGSSEISDLEMVIPHEYPEISDLNIDANLVRTEIENLDTSKSTGPDRLPALIIKRFSDIFTEILLLIFRKSYLEGKVPTQMKAANIRPIFKTGEKTDPSNYRPVSITPIIAKIYERIIKKHIEKHVNQQDIMSDCQHGFRQAKSTSTNLIQFTNDLANYANETKSISIVYTDLRKAFDCIPHDLLLYKLDKYGIRGKTKKWLQEFLSNRMQRVRIGEELSESCEVLSGVPQGGALSGLLFALYINDLDRHIKTASISLYADDAKIYLPIVNEEAVVSMQEDLNRLAKWCSTWRMSLNPSKCYLLQYNPRSINRQFNPSYTINGVPIQRSSVVKDLGVLVSEQLKFHQQVDQVCKKAHAEINRIRRSFISRTPSFIADMYKLYVRPHLEYAVEVWNPRDRGDVLKLEKVQNKMSRLLPTGHILHPDQRNATLGLTTHEERRLRGDLINIYKQINNESLFTLRNNPRFRGHSKTIRVPLSNCLIKKYSFSYRAINDWNNLPESIVNSQSLNVFKRNIDVFMFDR